MLYQDFDLWIDSDGNNRYLIRAEAHTAARGGFVFDPTTQQSLINITGTENRHSLELLATELFNRVFQGEAGRLYQQSLGRVIDRELGLRMRLRTTAAPDGEVPWELMFDGKHFVGASTKTLLIRHLPGITPPLKIEPPVNALILGPQIAGGSAKGEIIRETLREFEPIIAAQFKPCDLTPGAIRDALEEHDHHIVHFAGTLQTGEPVDAAGSAQMDPGSVSLLFEPHSSTKLVIFDPFVNESPAGVGNLFLISDRLVSDSLPAVVALRNPLSEPAAQLFVRAFYRSLCSSDEHGRVDVAIGCARRSLCERFPQSIAFISPVLFTRSASGTIFTYGNQSEKPVESVRQLHTTQAVVDTHAANQEILEQQKAVAAPEQQAQIQEQIETENEAAKASKDRIRNWRKRVVVRGAVLTLAIFAACWVGLFGVLNLNKYLERKFVSYMDASIDKPIAPEVRVVTINEGDNGTFGVLKEEDPKWRANYAKLIRDFADAGARTIVLDIFFKNRQLSPDEAEATDKLAAAVKYALDEKHVGVIVGVTTEQKNLAELGKIKTELPGQMKDLLADYRGDANVLLQERQTLLVREIRLGTVSPGFSGCPGSETAVLPSLSLLAVMNFRGAKRACLSPNQSEITLRDAFQNPVISVPVFSNYSRGDETLMVNKLDVTPAPRISDFSKPIERLYNPSNVLADPGWCAGCILIVGVKREGGCFGPAERDVWCVSDSEPGERNGKRFGVEIHANVISNLLTGTYVNPVPITIDLLLIVLMIGLGIGFQFAGPGWLAEPLQIPIPWTDTKVPIPLLLFVVTAIYLLLMYSAYQRWRLLLPNAAYHITALIISYFMTRRMRKRLGLR
jgi:CHASE2 domain-containing sensor protein